MDGTLLLMRSLTRLEKLSMIRGSLSGGLGVSTSASRDALCSEKSAHAYDSQANLGLHPALEASGSGLACIRCQTDKALVPANMRLVKKPCDSRDARFRPAVL